MKRLNFFFVLILSFIISSCKENIFNINEVEEGLPAKVKISVTVPKNNTLEVTKSGDVDYALTKLTLFFYRWYNPSGLPEVIDVDLSNMSQSSYNTQTGEAVYSLNSEFATTSGHYNIYAVANWDNNLSPVDTDALSKLKQSEFENAIFEKNHNDIQFVGNSVLMTGKAKPNDNTNSYVVISDDASIITPLSISLTRAYSKIQFNITVDKSEDANRQFVPTSYGVYNVPKKAALIKGGSLGALTSDDYHNYPEVKLLTTDTSFGFVVPENLQAAKKDIDKDIDIDKQKLKWKLRESYTNNNPGSSSTFTERTYTHAPDNGTYVVISGFYTDSKYMGNVAYTVHLGDFSKENKYDFNNYNVDRNCIYKYNITVKGIKSIITEAENNGNSSGQEGTITDVSQTFYVDCHYESALLNFKSQHTEYAVIIKDPFIEKTYVKNEILDADDGFIADSFSWIKFYNHSGKTIAKGDLAPYPGDASKDLMNIKQFVKHILNSNDADQTFTVFIDEYYYENRSWLEFVNKGNRMMTIAITSKQSSDQNSSYLKPLLSFIQRPIETVYDRKDIEGYIPFGVETINETGLQLWKNNQLGSARSDTDGNLNTRNNINQANNKYYSTFVNIAKNGWKKDTDGNDIRATGSEILKSGGGTKSSTYGTAYYQCLTRNRASNGSTIQDKDIKWYIPALDQYMYLWLGEDALSSLAKLFQSDWWTTNSYGTEMLLYTSSNNEYREFWGVEGCAFGSSKNRSQHTKCVRNLKSNKTASETKPTPVYEYDKKTMTFTISTLNTSALRTSYMTGEYVSHNEREKANTLPLKFQVANKDLTNKGSILFNSSFELNEIKTGELCKKNYTQDPGGLDKGQWRIPNQKELAVMVICDDLEIKKDKPTASSTFFSFASKAGGNRNGVFNYNGDITISNSAAIFTPRYTVRCVRDVK